MKKNTTINIAIIGSLIIAISTFIYFNNKANDIEIPDTLPTESEQVEPTETDSTENEELNLSDYFLYKENAIYKYVRVENDFPADPTYNPYNQERFLLYKNGDVSQIKIKHTDPYAEFVEVIEVTDDSAELLYNSSNYRYNNVDLTDNLPIDYSTTILKTPIAIGESWSLGDEFVSEITAVDLEVEVPFGKFNAIEVTTNYSDGNYEKNYYVNGLGLIKTIVSNITTGEHVSVLESVTENTEFTSNITLYNYDVVMDNVVEEEIPISYQFNPNFEEILENILKTVSNENYIQLLTPNTKINSVTLNYDTSYAVNNDESVTLDLSNDYLKELNVGASIESTMVQCLVDTVGSYYGVPNVIILIDGEKAESGHVLYGDPMPVSNPETYFIN